MWISKQKFEDQQKIVEGLFKRIESLERFLNVEYEHGFYEKVYKEYGYDFEHKRKDSQKCSS